MLRDLTNIEYLIAHKTAQEYRSKGYEVIREAPLDFFHDFTADLLVHKDCQSKVIEVMTRSSLATYNHSIGELAKMIESKPCWSFELILVGEPHKLHSPKGAHSFKGESIDLLIKQSRKSLEAGLPEAAFLLAWSAAEATIRELLTEEVAPSDTVTSPQHVLSLGVFNGILARRESDALEHLRKYRNAIVHGFSVDDFSEDMVIQLIEIIDAVVVEFAASAEDGEF